MADQLIPFDAAQPAGSRLPVAVKAEIGETFASPAQVGALNVTNLAGLERWGAVRGDALNRPVVISCVGDSITWGVGSDGNPLENDPGFLPVARQMAWPVQLRRRLAADLGMAWTEDFIGLTSGWGYATVVGASSSASIGPFGGYTTGGAGGRSMAGTAQTVTVPAANTQPFTELDVYYWGPDGGVSNPTDPTITVDGAVVHTGGATPAGNLLKRTITGLANTTHEVVLSGVVGGKTAFVSHIVTRRATGFVVNRIARSGATTVDASGGAQTGPARTRVLTSHAADADLMIICLGANDQPQQIPLATYQANLQAQIDIVVAQGGCVLLLGAPPLASPTGALVEQDYRNVMRSLALANPNVAYTDLRRTFGDRAKGWSLGLYPTAGTIHPSRKGHAMTASSVYSLLNLPSYAP